ncbi:MAG: hypothetical protein ACYTG0_17925 [Planctomycetota bacterium]
MYGRMGADAIQDSQSRLSGTGSWPLGRSNPCGQIGRLVQKWASVTSPMAPARMTSTVRTVDSLPRDGVPMCVASFFSAATSAIRRASFTSRVSGFSQ